MSTLGTVSPLLRGTESPSHRARCKQRLRTAGEKPMCPVPAFCRDARVYDHTTTAVHDGEYSPPPLPYLRPNRVIVVIAPHKLDFPDVADIKLGHDLLPLERVLAHVRELNLIVLRIPLSCPRRGGLGSLAAPSAILVYTNAQVCVTRKQALLVGFGLCLGWDKRGERLVYALF